MTYERRIRYCCKIPFCTELAAYAILVDGKQRGKYCLKHGPEMLHSYKRPGFTVTLMEIENPVTVRQQLRGPKKP